ncbi:MAG: quinolinate synthase NadA [Desulfomonile tiedjei]|nr:quinolinate synthase NadA [Desulfomonile tiedjei]
MINTVILPESDSLTEKDIPSTLDLEAAIDDLRREKNAVILAHYYQDGKIQDLADYVGDSLDLSRKAAQTTADVIVFCGVRFMAEVAKILSPTRKVLIPDANAGCTLEESCQPEDLSEFSRIHPDHQLVTYINCSAEVKALSDVIVTSSNAEAIVRQLPADRPILFSPDQHLGRYISQKTGRDMTLWPGSCVVHTQFSVTTLEQLRADNPNALVVAHPECPEEVLAHADHIGSTRSLLDFAIATPATEIIVATEPNLLHEMRKAAPHKKYIPVPGATEGCKGGLCAFCPFMALNTMEKLYLCLVNEAPGIEMPESLMMRARKPLDRMLELSPPAKSYAPE